MIRQNGNSVSAQVLFLLWLCLMMSGCARVAVRTGAPDQAAVPIPSAIANIEAQPQWFTCKAATDCMPIGGVCQSQSAVNKRFENQYLQYRTRMEAQVECQAPDPQAHGSWAASCIRNRCAVKP